VGSSVTPRAIGTAALPSPVADCRSIGLRAAANVVNAAGLAEYSSNNSRAKVSAVLAAAGCTRGNAAAIGWSWYGSAAGTAVGGGAAAAYDDTEA